MTKIPENSAQNSPPEALQETSFACWHCDADFETAHDLHDHVQDCDEKED